jgi:predicted anti-sigma-YlaC factor YlaD
MSCDDFDAMVSGYLDGELTAEQHAAFEAHLRGCPECQRQLAEMTALKERLAMMKFKEPSDVELERYWATVYTRLERGAAWVLLSLGAILLLCYGSFRLLEGLIKDPTVDVLVKIGVVALVFGLVILFVSLLRERLAVRKADKYSKEIER